MVHLTVTNAGGSTTLTKEGYITTLPPAPVAAFTADRTGDIVPVPVVFSDLSSGVIDSWLWDFGDGTTSALQHPSHTYSLPGNYTVRLTVTNAGGSTTLTKEGYITTLPPAPVAAFTADRTEGNAPLSIVFDDLSTGVVDSWLWDFGDGNQSSYHRPIHKYTSPGVYSVSLNVSNGGGSHSLMRTNYINLLRAFPNPAGGYFPKPLDLNGDGLYSDLDGNGWVGFNDVVLLYSHLEPLRRGAHGQPELFDYDGNGWVGFNDVIILYEMMHG
jgi:PKD repeat protein